MIELKTQKRLQELFRRENRSFLQYVTQATPWAAAEDRGLVDKLHSLAHEEMQALRELAEWLDARQVALPYLGAFPTTFTHYNFVAIRKLMKPLIDEQKKELADLEADVLAISDDAARAPLRKLVELNRQHLRDFEQITHAAR